MLALLRKEIAGFLSSLIGYIVIITFLIFMSLFMWVIPGPSNVIETGYSNIDGLFSITPYLYLFLIPAITMKSFAEEKRNGTIETLLTAPISEFQLVLAKYLAGVLLVILSILPTVFYYLTVYQYGNPIGNIDSGGTWGSYIGLLFLGIAFVSIGLFTSSISDNQVVSFVLAVVFCYICFIGFDTLSEIEALKNFDFLLLNLSINSHYVSMSRGVIDSRDVIYFLGLVFVFLLATKTVIESRKW
jgi:ABC-2 type transport system permease protein